MLVSADVLTSSSLSDALEGIDYDARVQENNITWTIPQFDALQDIIEELPEVNSADRFTKITYTHNSTLGQSFEIVGLETYTAIWEGLQHVNGSLTLQANETYIVSSSVNASKLSSGETIHVPVRILTTDSPFPKTIYVNLTIAGYVDISEQTARLLHPPTVIDLGFIQFEMDNGRNYNLLLADWDLTFKPLLEYYTNLANTTRMLETSGFVCQLNRDILINPFDIGGSSTNIANAVSKIEDRTAAYNTRVTNLVSTTLTFASLASTVLVLTFVVQAVPILFMAWYSSTMLSDVSYNLRRREFGLLQTRGIAPKSIKRMLLFEGAIIGIIGGVLGLVLGVVFGHIVVNVPLTDPLGVILRNPVNAIVVVLFSLIISIWSVRGPADRASKLDPLDSLKQYVYIEEQRQYKRLLPTIALVLGTYKIIVWALGISISTLLSAALSTNFILLIVVAIWSPIDAFLNFAGPILFLYGITKILLKGSEKFQESVMNAGVRIFGAFGKLSTRNVKRNPVRNAALVFVISLIVSYGVYSVGILFTENDRLERDHLFAVGADFSATFSSGENLTSVVDTIQDLEGVESLTVEYRLTMSSTRSGLGVRGINTSNWRDSAYYEDIWFSYDTLDELFSNFTGNKILLSLSVARQLDLRVGNFITLRGTSASDIHRMEIIGFVGYPSLFEGIIGQFAFGGSYQSYVPIDFLEDTGLINYAEGHVLVNTEPSVNGTLLESEVESMFPQVESTDSFTSRVAAAQESSYQVGGTRARLLGVTFAAVLAIVGTLLVITLTLREKQYETTLLGVRGFNWRQTLTVLAGEVMVLVLFSLILGTATGFIQLFGDISNTVESSSSIIRPQIILTPISIVSMLAIVFGVVLAALIPVINAARFSEERIDILRE